MPNWKKVIVSGSDATLASLRVDGQITGSTLQIVGVAEVNTSISTPHVRCTTIEAQNQFTASGDSLINGDMFMSDSKRLYGTASWAINVVNGGGGGGDGNGIYDGSGELIEYQTSASISGSLEFYGDASIPAFAGGERLLSIATTNSGSISVLSSDQGYSGFFNNAARSNRYDRVVIVSTTTDYKISHYENMIYLVPGTIGSLNVELPPASDAPRYLKLMHFGGTATFHIKANKAAGDILVNASNTYTHSLTTAYQKVELHSLDNFGRWVVWDT